MDLPIATITQTMKIVNFSLIQLATGQKKRENARAYIWESINGFLQPHHTPKMHRIAKT